MNLIRIFRIGHIKRLCLTFAVIQGQEDKNTYRLVPACDEPPETIGIFWEGDGEPNQTFSIV